VGGFPWPDVAGTSAKVLTSGRQRREPQMEIGKAGENGGYVGAAQGDLSRAEIVEQGPCALYLCKVGCPATLLRLILRQSKSFSS
jgi:hypothetical protein